MAESESRPPESPDSELYDLAPEKVAPPRRPPITSNVPLINSPVAPDDVVFGTKKLNYHGAQSRKSGTFDEEKLKNLYAPLWILGGGMVVLLLAAWLQPFVPIERLLPFLAKQIGATETLVFVGIAATATFRRIKLGPPAIVLLKLSAISVGLCAVSDVFDLPLAFLPGGGLMRSIGEFALSFALIGVLFDLDESDTWYCVAIIFVASVAVGILIRF